MLPLLKPPVVILTTHNIWLINLASGWIFILLFSQKSANTDNVNHQFDLDKRGVLQYDAKKTNWCQHKGYQWKTLSHSIFGRTHSVVISPKSCLISFWLYVQGQIYVFNAEGKKGKEISHLYLLLIKLDECAVLWRNGYFELNSPIDPVFFSCIITTI